MFQSLIGRLKTSHDGTPAGIWDLFQSLIGRLKTQGQDGIQQEPPIVSIPYR